MLPSVLLLYFLWRSLRQRVFLLGLPFLMDMYYSVFFERLKPFWVPGQWTPADHMMFWLLVTWIVYFDLLLPGRRRSVRERHLFGPRLSAPEEIVLVGFAAYMLFKVGTTAVHYMDLGSAISEARIPLYMFAGYFLLRGISVTPVERRRWTSSPRSSSSTRSRPASTCCIRGCTSTSTPGLVEYQYFVFDGEVLTRSFYFMPQYLPLAIAFCAAKRKWSLFWLGVLAVTLAAIWVSYTRSLVLVAMVEIAVILAIRLLKQRDAWPAAKRVLQIVLVMARVRRRSGHAAAHPVRLSLLAYRRHPVERQRAQGQQSAGSPQWWRTTNEWVGGDNRLLGVGFPSAAQDARVTEVGRWQRISCGCRRCGTWACSESPGWSACSSPSAWRATSLSLASEGDAAFLSTVLLGVIVGVFLLGFVEWTIFDPWHTPLALSFFALLAAERCRQRAEARQAVTVGGGEPPVLESVSAMASVGHSEMRSGCPSRRRTEGWRSSVELRAPSRGIRRA